MSDRSHLTVAGGQPGAVARRILFERAHPEVAIVVPVGLNGRWRGIVPFGKIPGRPDETTIGSYGLGGLMDQLDGQRLPPPISGDAGPGSVTLTDALAWRAQYGLLGDCNVEGAL